MKSNFDTTPQRYTCRRGFLREATIAACGAAFVRMANAESPSSVWGRIRDVVESGAIGKVTYASALVPFDENATPLADVIRFGISIPRAVSAALDGILIAVSQTDPDRIDVARRDELRAFSMNCALPGGETIAIATTQARVSLSVTIRGASGAIYLNGDSLIAVSNGRCRELHR